MKKNILLILLFLLSCENEKKLTFQTNGCILIDSCILSNDFTVFCYVDSANCTLCSMQWLDLWTFREDELKNSKTGVVLIIRNPDEQAVREALVHLKLEFPVVFDKSSTIKQNNPLILNHYSVFTVNREKEVVWLGLSIRDEKTWNMHLKTLKRHSKSNIKH